MFSFSMPELVLILVIALVVFGPGKLPEVGKALGKGIQEFRKATSGEATGNPAPKQEQTVTHEPAAKVETKSEEKK